MTKRHKVFFYFGPELTLKTSVQKGFASVDETGLRIEGPSGLLIQKENILTCRLFRLHGLGRVIELDYSEGRVYLSVVRLMIGQFALINFLKTGALHRELTLLSALPK